MREMFTALQRRLTPQTLRALLAAMLFGLAGTAWAAAPIHYAASPVPGSWIVEVVDSGEKRADLNQVATTAAARTGGDLGAVFSGRFRGFVLRGLDSSSVQLLANQSQVAALIQDEWYDQEGVLAAAAPYCYTDTPLTDTRNLPGVNPATVQIIDCTAPTGTTGPTCFDNWGLNRIGEESLPVDYRFQFPDNANDRRVYVYDTGVHRSHREFTQVFPHPTTNRVVQFHNATTEADGDLYGHGTHVAAIAAGRTFGTAKWADVYDTKVLDSNLSTGTSLSWLLSGFQAIKDDLQPANNPTDGIAVMNWSGGNVPNWITGTQKQYTTLRQNLVDLLETHENLLLVQAAGNQGADACTLSFGDDNLDGGLFSSVADQILIAGGTNPADERFDGPGSVESNFGPCVDLFSPAALVVSAFNTGDNHICQLTGTSMAAPHVSGVALVLSKLFPSYDAADIRDLLLDSATEGVLDPSTLGTGSPNRLLALQANDGLIFDDDFPGIGNWDDDVEVGLGDNTNCSGYCPSIESSSDAAYLVDESPTNEYIYRVSFLLYRDDMVFGASSDLTLFRARGVSDATLFEVILETPPPSLVEATPSLKVVVQTNSGPVEQVVSLPAAGGLVDPTIQLEFEWVPSAFSSDDQGHFRLWSGLWALQNIDLEISLDDLDTYGMQVHSALLGIVDANGFTEGQLGFGEYRSRREDLAISF